jgi:hypothetical protein
MNFERRAFLELRHKIGLSVNGQINTKGQATFLIRANYRFIKRVWKTKVELGLTYLLIRTLNQKKVWSGANLVSSLSQTFASNDEAGLCQCGSKSLHSHR